MQSGAKISKKLQEIVESQQWLPEGTRRTGKKGCSVLCHSEYLKERGSKSILCVEISLVFLTPSQNRNPVCVFSVVNRDKWIPCPSGGECWSKLLRKAQWGAGMAKLCRTRAEQVERGSAEPWPAPALCSYCLQHDPFLSRASLHGNKMESTPVRLLWTRMTLNWIKCFVFCRHLFVGRGTNCI